MWATPNTTMASEERVKDHDLFVENSPLFKRMSIVCHVTIFLYATSFWIQIGVFPFFTRKLGVDTVTYGYLQTVSAVAMLLGGPLFGRTGDIFGAKAVFLVSFAGSFLVYFLVVIADSVYYLFLSRLLSFFMNAMQCAQMVITDVTGTRDRAMAMGHLTVAYGLGMIVGPTLGGWVTRFSSEQSAVGVSASLMVFAFFIVMVAMPTYTKDPRKIRKTTNECTNSNKDKNIFNMAAIISLLSIPNVLYLISVRTLVGIPAGIYHSMFSVINMERYNLTAEVNGYILTYIGILTAIMQSVGIKLFTKRFSDIVIIRISISIMSLSYLMLVGVSSVWLLCIILIPMVVSGSLMNTIAISTLTKSVPEKDTGTTIGLNMATNSLIRTVTPTIGSYLYTWLGYYSFGIFGFIFNGTVALLVFIHPPSGLH